MLPVQVCTVRVKQQIGLVTHKSPFSYESHTTFVPTNKMSTVVVVVVAAVVEAVRRDMQSASHRSILVSTGT